MTTQPWNPNQPVAATPPLKPIPHATPPVVERSVLSAVPPTPAPKIRFNQVELAERWGMSPSTLERWRVEGVGPCYLRLRGRILYRLEDIEAFELKSLRQTETGCGPAGGAA